MYMGSFFLCASSTYNYITYNYPICLISVALTICATVRLCARDNTHITYTFKWNRNPVWAFKCMS